MRSDFAIPRCVQPNRDFMTTDKPLGQIFWKHVLEAFRIDSRGSKQSIVQLPPYEGTDTVRQSHVPRPGPFAMKHLLGRMVESVGTWHCCWQGSQGETPRLGLHSLQTKLSEFGPQTNQEVTLGRQQQPPIRSRFFSRPASNPDCPSVRRP